MDSGTECDPYWPEFTLSKPSLQKCTKVTTRKVRKLTQLSINSTLETKLRAGRQLLFQQSFDWVNQLRKPRKKFHFSASQKKFLSYYVMVASNIDQQIFKVFCLAILSFEKSCHFAVFVQVD